MRNFFLRLMAGRYGIDQLHNALLVLCFALLLLSRLLHIAWLEILSLLLLLLCYFRCFSRNINARYRENQKFLAAVQPLRKWFGGLRQRFRDRKTHRYFSCPTCGMTLRVPKGKGKINISCPKCRTQFIKKT